MLMKLRAVGIPASLEEMSDAFCQQLPEETKKNLILHGFTWLETRKPHADTHKAVYDKALMI